MVAVTRTGRACDGRLRPQVEPFARNNMQREHPLSEEPASPVLAQPFKPTEKTRSVFSVNHFTSIERALLTGCFLASVSVSTPFSSLAAVASTSISWGSS